MAQGRSCRHNTAVALLLTLLAVSTHGALPRQHLWQLQQTNGSSSSDATITRQPSRAHVHGRARSEAALRLRVHEDSLWHHGKEQHHLKKVQYPHSPGQDPSSLQPDSTGTTQSSASHPSALPRAAKPDSQAQGSSAYRQDGTASQPVQPARDMTQAGRTDRQGNVAAGSVAGGCATARVPWGSKQDTRAVQGGPTQRTPRQRRLASGGTPIRIHTEFQLPAGMSASLASGVQALATAAILTLQQYVDVSAGTGGSGEVAVWGL